MSFNQPNHKGYDYYSHIYSQNRNHNNRENTMTVEGNGSITVQPDQARIVIGVVTENQNVQQAQQENTRISNAIIQAIKQLGIDEKDMRTTTYSVSPRYDYIEGKSVLRGFEVEHLFEVTVNDLSKIGAIYDAAIRNGANRSGTIQFRVSNPGCLLSRSVNTCNSTGTGKSRDDGEINWSYYSTHPDKNN